MASYDSDSSSEDDLGVQTNVTLGYTTQEHTGDEISRVGGHPTWLHPDTKPSGALATCKVCNGYMSLLLQLQADLQQYFPDDERRLFVWCCRKRQCSKKPGSIRAFREVKKANSVRKSQVPKEEKIASPLPQQNLGSQLFGGPLSPGANSNSNPFSTSSTAQPSRNPFSSAPQVNGTSEKALFSELAAIPPQPPTQSFADKLKISSPPNSSKPSLSEPQTEPWPAESSFPTPYSSFYIDAESEYLEPTKPESAPSSSNTRITELDDESSTSTSAAEKDLYESPHDKTFSHFTKILSQNPEQILRYEFKGTPLLYSGTDPTAAHFMIPHHNNSNSKIKTAGPVKGVPSCQHCGAARVFEMQLAPYLIYELEKDNEEAMKLDGGEGMEWGTVIVGTCSKNCGSEGTVTHREEWVGVQWEEGGVELKQRK